MRDQDLTLAIEFTATDKGLSGKINLTKAELEKLNKIQRDGVPVSDNAVASNRRHERSLFALKAGAAAVVTGLAALSLKTISVIRDTERMTAQLVTATGSLNGGAAAFERLNQFAKQTPYTLQQSVESFKTLKNLGLDPSERAMRSYGNTAAAMGKDMTQMIEAVADATTGEFERLKEFGIKTKQQGDQVTFTFRNVETTVQKSSKNIQEYLLGIGETHFADAMSNQMDTIDGKLSNLEATVNDFFRVLGDDNAAMDAFKKGIDWVTEAIDNATVALKFFKANLKAEEIAENTQAIADTIKSIESANEELARRNNKTGRSYQGLIKGIKENVAELKILGEEYTKLHPVIVKATKDAANLDNQNKKNNNSTGKFNKNLAQTKNKLDDMTGPMSVYTALLEEGERLTLSMRTEQEELTDTFERYAALLQTGAIDQETYNRAVAKSITTFNHSSVTAKKASQQITQTADPFYEAWKNAFERLDDAGAQYWKNLFTGAENSLDSIKELTASWAAEMAHTLLTKPLTMNIQASILGTGSASGQAQSSLMGSQNNINSFSLPEGTVAGLDSFGASYFGAPAGSAGEFAAFDSVSFEQLGADGITGSMTGGTQGLGNMASAGLGGLFAGYGGASMTGNAFSGAALGAGQIGLMGGLSGMAGGAGFMAGAGGALAAMGPVGWAALAIGALAGSGAFGGDKDMTPDLNLNYNNAYNNNPGRPKGLYKFDYAENDVSTAYAGRFASFGFSTQHDAFDDEAKAKEFADAMTTRYATLENAIFSSFGKTISQEISDAMAQFNSGEIKFEDFAGSNDFTVAFSNIFSQIFAAVGVNANEDVARYKDVFVDAFNATGHVDTGVLAVSSVKSVMDNNTSRSFDDVVDSVILFTTKVTELDDQMTELAAITSLLNLEALNDDFATFVDSIGELNEFDGLASELFQLGSQLISVNTILQNTSQSAFELSMSGAELADNLVAAAGGIEAFNSKTTFYYQNFFTEEERRNDLIEQSEQVVAQFNEQFGEFGTVSISAKNSLRDYMSALDLTSAAEQKAYNAALNLAPALLDGANAMQAMINSIANLKQQSVSLAERYNDTLSKSNLEQKWATKITDVNQWLDSLTAKGVNQSTVDSYKINAGTVAGLDAQWAKLGDAIADNSSWFTEQFGNSFTSEATAILTGWTKDSAKWLQLSRVDAYGNSTLSKTVTSTNSALSDFSAGLSDAGNSLLSFINNLTVGALSPLSPVEQLDAMSSVYNEQFAAVRGGNTDMVSDLTATASSYLNAARDVYASSQDYTDIFNGVYGGLKALGLSLGGTLPSYSTGTSYVDGDQIAQIHDAEMVIDAQTSAQLRKYGIKSNTGGSNTAEVRALKQEITLLRQDLREQAQFAAKQRSQNTQAVNQSSDKIVRASRQTTSTMARV